MTPETPHQDRQPAGTPTGGQFASRQHAESTVSLTAADTPSATPADATTAPGEMPSPAAGEFEIGLDDAELASKLTELPSMREIAEANADTLPSLVSHPVPYIRALVSGHPGLTDEQLAELADPSQHWAVRGAVAQMMHPGAAGRAARDPDPVVRFHALDGWDLPQEDRERLRDDPEVQKVARVLARRYAHTVAAADAQDQWWRQDPYLADATA